jgi:hypothetical protein
MLLAPDQGLPDEAGRVASFILPGKAHKKSAAVAVSDYRDR